MICTGSFLEIQKYKQAGFVPVSIAGCTPEGYEGIEFKTLAPKHSWWSEWHNNQLSKDWYENKYNETVLDKLNPTVIVNKLNSFGDKVVLCCYEPPYEFCHRHLFRRLLNNIYHIQCDEFDVPTFLRKMADWAEKNHELIRKDDYYEYAEDMGEAIFDYE